MVVLRLGTTEVGGLGSVGHRFMDAVMVPRVETAETDSDVRVQVGREIPAMVLRFGTAEVQQCRGDPVGDLPAVVVLRFETAQAGLLVC